MRNVMLRLTAARYRWLPALALAVGLAAAFSSGGHVVAQEGGDFSADCEGNSLQVDSDCDFGSGQEFTVAIHVVGGPADGYSSFQVKLRWDEAVLEYRPTDSPDDEVVWDHCSIPARSDNTAGLPDRPLEPSVLFGCFPFPLPESLFVDSGPILLFTFVCVGDGSSTLALVPRAGDQQQGSHFVDLFGNSTEPPPSLADASVTCGGAEKERPPAEIETNPPGDIDPDATPLNGEDTTPVESDVTPVLTQTPGGPTATPALTPTRIASEEDGDDDDGGLPAWAWVLIVLGIVAGVGGVGFAAWRKMNEEGSGTSDPDASETAAPDADKDA